MRKEKKYHYIYKTTNVINEKYYIGMHSTDNLDDDYIGSGKYLWNSINYHGRDYHVKEILEFVDTRKELKVREEEIVNEQLINEALCMNIRVGGQGGYLGFEATSKGGKTVQEKYKGKTSPWGSKGGKAKFKLHGCEELNKFKYTNKGGTLSDEHKKAISETNKGQGKGSSNSQYGKCWITNEIESKKINKGDEVPKGWRLGRKMK